MSNTLSSLGPVPVQSPLSRSRRLLNFMQRRVIIVIMTFVGTMILTHYIREVQTPVSEYWPAMITMFVLFIGIVVPVLLMLLAGGKTFISAFGLVQVYFVLIPTLSVATLMWQFTSILFYAMCFFIIAAMALFPVRRRYIRMQGRLFVQFYVLIVAVNTVMLLLFYPINFAFLTDLRVIYQFRAETSISLPPLNGIMLYAALPTLIFVCVRQGKYKWLVPLCLIGPLLYMITGHKFLFVLPFFYLLFSLISGSYRIVGPVILLVSMLVTMIGTWLGNEWVQPIVVHRSFSVPGTLAVLYYEFFDPLPKAYWGTFFGLSAFGYYPFGDVPLVKMFSLHYFGDEMWANTGFLPFLFANFGFFTFLMLIPIMLFFRLFDSLILRPDVAIYVGMIGGLLMVNGSFLNAMLSNGFVLTMLCFIPLSSMALNRK